MADVSIEKARETARALHTWANGAPRVASNVMQEGAACIEVLAAEIVQLQETICNKPPPGYVTMTKQRHDAMQAEIARLRERVDNLIEANNVMVARERDAKRKAAEAAITAGVLANFVAQEAQRVGMDEDELLRNFDAIKQSMGL